MKQATKRKLTIPTLRERLDAITEELELAIAAYVDAVKAENPSIPRAGIEQRLFAKVRGCRCEAFKLVDEGKV